jgi:hypothetical protein
MRAIIRTRIRLLVALATGVPHFVSCATSELISQRPVDPAIAQEPVTHGPGVQTPERQDLFTRERRAVIKEIQRDPDATGSLFPLDDPRTNLIVQNPLRTGMLLDVKVVAARSAAGDGAKSTKGSTKPGDASNAGGDVAASVPKLEPAEPGAAPLKSIKMRLDSILPNGDGIVTVTRSSSREGEFHEVYARASIPAERMIPGAALTTSDLFDVTFSDFDGTRTTERRSTAWEDEYSLRLSGFDELRSKQAIAVEESRRQVEAEKEKIAEESRKVADERARSAKQRDELQQKLRDAEAKIAELQKGAVADAKSAQAAAPAAAPATPAAKGGADAKK